MCAEGLWVTGQCTLGSQDPRVFPDLYVATEQGEPWAADFGPAVYAGGASVSSFAKQSNAEDLPLSLLPEHDLSP